MVYDDVIADEDVPSRLSDVLATPVRLLALSLDAKLHAGHWQTVGQAPIRDDLPLPAYKEAVTSGDHVDVVDYTGLRRRRASKDEVESLPFRKVVAPVRLERALRASLGLEPWLAAFDDLKPHGLTSKGAFHDGS
ncbi:hypothetical protein N802_02075 [Knoellia sinensis KCTC 19936]|uniref:Uncharacterized protein n=1 Tax=Knoellia sinensis KCTC 19936 TaxID=1385520 RepID=A0A0A0JE51_9MICO|nr:hypothetical protein N802_02075 [Knoellia sinensis KCTC 19936]